MKVNGTETSCVLMYSPIKSGRFEMSCSKDVNYACVEHRYDRGIQERREKRTYYRTEIVLRLDFEKGERHVLWFWNISTAGLPRAT